MVVDALLAAILRGEYVDASALARHDPETIGLAASSHDIVPLLAERLASRADVPDEHRGWLRDGASRAVAADLIREVELKRFLAELGAASVSALIVKGSHLAYSHYPRPDLRPRVDTDVLVPVAVRETVHEILTARLGYEAISKVSGGTSSGRRLYVKHRDGALMHAIDVQWKLESPHLFADVASYDEMTTTAVPLPRLGPGARGPSDVYALLIACIHRLAHHHDEVHFKWSYDIDVIARGLSGDQWESFATLAVDRKVAAVCARSLERAAYWFRTEIPIGIWSGSRRTSAPH